MAGFVRPEFANQAVAEQVDVANRVENLVNYKLVGVTKTVLIENAIVIKNDRVVHAAAKRQVAFAERFHIS